MVQKQSHLQKPKIVKKLCKNLSKSGLSFVIGIGIVPEVNVSVP